MRFIKKPEIIEAFQMTLARRDSRKDWPEWLHQAWAKPRGTVGSLYFMHEERTSGMLQLGAWDAVRIVPWSYWITRDVLGDLALLAPERFEKLYQSFPLDRSLNV